MTAVILRDVEVAGTAKLDVLVRDGVILEITENSVAAPDVEVIDGHGGALLPGLHDHHIHLHALAADRLSVRCGPPHVRTADELAAALGSASDDGWIRGVGYFESVAGMLDSTSVDALHHERPVRIQHRSGALWILNSRAAEQVGLDSADHPGVERDDDGRATGRLWRADSWLREHLPASGPPDLADLGAELAAYGITGLTDATPDLTASSVAALHEAHLSGAVPQRMLLLGAPLDFPGSAEDFAVGPLKIVLADSGLPDFEWLIATVRNTHDAGRAVAVHCVSREAFAILLAVFGEVGTIAGDRIEHGAIIPPDSVEDIRRLGVHVVTQPGFLADRGDAYLREVEEADLPDLYRCRSLLGGGVPLALSSDAPYGPVDPWAVIRAAVTRRCPTGAVVGSDERLTPSQALDGYLARLDDPGGPPRTLRPGMPADLVLLDRPLRDMLDDPTADAVHTTLIAGRSVYHR